MKTIAFLFNLLLFTAPIVFFPKTSELFEFNKIVLIYIFAVLILAAWANECVAQKRFIFKANPLTIPILIFLASLAVSTINSIDIRTSIYGYYGRFHGGLLSYISYSVLYFVFVTFMNKQRSIEALKILLISSTIASVWAALEHFGIGLSCLIINGQADNSCWVQDVKERVFGTFGQPNWLAAFLAATAPLSFSFYLDFPKKRPLYFVLTLLMFATLLFTKSRSGIMGFIIAFIVFATLAFYAQRAKLKKALKPFLMFVVSAIVIFIAINPLALPQKSAETLPSDYQGGTESGEIRQIVWRGAIDLWKRYPITGTGVETFAYSYYETRPVAHNSTSEWNYLYNKAHNEYLNYAATTGALGLGSYLLLVVSSLFVLIKNKKSFLSIALLAGYISILITNFFGFSTTTLSLLFFLFPAISLELR